MDYPDIYYYPPYLELFEDALHGKATLYRHQSNLGEVCYAFYVRPVELVGTRKDCFDTITPHGYGGPVITKSAPGEEQNLIHEFDVAFSQYCRTQKIVSEFIRFHPVLKNVDYCKDIYSVTPVGQTVAIDLTLNNPFEESFSSSCRNKIRKSVKNGITVEFDFGGKTIEAFHRLYALTMDKNHAQDYYFFSEEFFRATIRKLYGNIFILNAISEGRIVTSALFLHYTHFMHTFLSATDPEYYKLGCKNLIYAEAANWGKKNDKDSLHLGGGLENLLVFKKSFVKEEGMRDLWIGKKVRNQEIYDCLVDEAKLKNAIRNNDFFPLYRG